MNPMMEMNVLSMLEVDFFSWIVLNAIQKILGKSDDNTEPFVIEW